MMTAPKVVTIATLDTSTTQEVFDHISYHLMTQKAVCMDSDGSMCLYFNPDTNRKCAAGCLFAPHEYNLKYEGRDWGTLLSHDIVPEAHSGLIETLQNIHDNVPPEKWAACLKDIARDSKLQPTYCKES